MRNKFPVSAISCFLGFLLPLCIFGVLNCIKNTNSPLLYEFTLDTRIADTYSTTEVTQFKQIPVLFRDGRIEMIDIDSYVLSVILCEMPVSFDREALKAQSVVARTYALKQHNNASKHLDAAVCTDPGCCQGYTNIDEFFEGGGTHDQYEKVREAVEATSGIVLTYDGELIDATYFSCSGGLTEDALSVWGTDIPYLQSTESPGEETSTNYVKTMVIPVSEFQKLLSLDTKESPLIENPVYTTGGGIDTIRIDGVLYKGTELRKLLNLRSTAFVITVIGDSVTITTKGYGHRVGMSQYGADAMARKGATFEEILKHYYTGTELSSAVDW